MLRQFEVLPIYSCFENYGHIKALLERQGQRIDDFYRHVERPLYRVSSQKLAHNLNLYLRCEQKF